MMVSAYLEMPVDPNWKKSKSTYRKYLRKKCLDVIVECNMKILNYLDVTFNLNDGTYKPHKKPNKEMKYIHVYSNHPPSIIKQIPNQ